MSDSPKDKKPSDHPTMLYQVLLEEYRTLEVFDRNEAEEVWKLYRWLKNRYGIVFGEAYDKLERPEKRKQLLCRVGIYDLLLRKVRKGLHGGAKGLTALCLSGGGIRSATFALGVIQGLARHKLLDKFDYLSSVSGGGYIASWLSAWVHRKSLASGRNAWDLDAMSISDVQDELNMRSASRPEPDEIAHLRSYSNYMSPRASLFSTDTWALIGVYLRNLVLNWSVIVPLLAAFLLVPRLLVVLLQQSRPADALYLVVAAGLFGLFSITCINLMRPSFKNLSPFRYAYSTDDIGEVRSVKAQVGLFCLVPLVLMSFVVTVGVSWHVEDFSRFSLSDYMIFGVALTTLSLPPSWFIFAMIGRYSLSIGQTVRVRAGLTRLRTYLYEFVISIVCGLFGGLLLYFAVTKFLLGDLASLLQITRTEFLLSFAVPAILVVVLVTATLFVALSVFVLDDDDREWATRFGALVLKTIVVWLAVTCAVTIGPQLFDYDFGYYKTRIAAVAAVVSGILSALAGFSSKTPSQTNSPAKDRSGMLISLASSVVAPIVVILLLIAISHFTNKLQYHILPGTVLENAIANLTYGVDWVRLNYKPILFVAFVAFGSLMGIFVNVNKFSIHSTYRERLIRAYLGASNETRSSTAHSFIGLDTEADNVEMKDLRQKPFHIVNMALNMVRTSNLAWQNRKAQSFTVSALHTGSSQMGKSGNFRRSQFYGMNRQSDRAITLGTAAAISGAAASPNMGRFTQSAAVSFLMVLLNVRLGWWLGNPGQRGRTLGAWKSAAPRWSPPAFVNESLGLTDDLHRFVYLADGGQFENLGLYEMVVRRCKTIILCDAGSDATRTFSDLGSAIHKIRVDMGIPIKFEAGKEPKEGAYAAVATIKYSEVDGNDASDGTLIYIKPTLDGSESSDIYNYQIENKHFPHEGTLDQFYSETQFESYRALGSHIVETLINRNKVDDLTGFVKSVRDYRRWQRP